MDCICARALVILAAALLLCPLALAAETEVVTVDAGADLGPVTYRASGFLHGMTAEVPAQELVAPLKPQLFRNEEEDAFGIYPRVKALGARAQLVVSDSFGYDEDQRWPGDGGDWSAWERVVTSLAEHAQKQGYTFEWDIWNEPLDDYFWKRGHDQFLETWRHGVTALRRIDPKAVVVGPSFASYDSKNMEEFLVYAKAHQVVPDILCWHELDEAGPGYETLPANMADAQRLMQKHGVRIAHICINEIIGRDLHPRPGAAVRFFAALERAKVDGACHATWPDEDGHGNRASLSGTLTKGDRRPRSVWWAYKAYADITGRLVVVQASKTVDAVAGRDASAKEVRVVLGRVAGGPEAVELRVTNLRGAGLSGQRVHVTAERIPNSGWKALPAPLPALDADYQVSDDSVVIALPDFGPDDAYAVALRPAAQP